MTSWISPGSNPVVVRADGGVPAGHQRCDVLGADPRDRTQVLVAEPGGVDHPLGAHVLGQHAPAVGAVVERLPQVLPVLRVHDWIREARQRHDGAERVAAPAVLERPVGARVLGGAGHHLPVPPTWSAPAARGDVVHRVELVLALVAEPCDPVVALDRGALGLGGAVGGQEPVGDAAVQPQQPVALPPVEPVRRHFLEQGDAQRLEASLGRGGGANLHALAGEVDDALQEPPGRDHAAGLAGALCAADDDLVGQLGAVDDDPALLGAGEPDARVGGLVVPALVAAVEHAAERLDPGGDHRRSIGKDLDALRIWPNGEEPDPVVNEAPIAS